MSPTARAVRILMLSSSLLLVACTGSDPLPTATAAATELPTPNTPTLEPSPTEPEPAGTISVWLSWPPEAIRQLNELIDAHRQRNPNVAFSVSYVPADELRATLESAFDSGSPPTLFLAPSAWGPELMQAGLLVDLAQLPLAQLEAVVQPLAWSQVESGGRTLGLPLRMHGRVLYRNRELAPVPAATVESLVEAAQGFRGTLTVGMSLDFGYQTVGPFARACGGPLLEQGTPLDLSGPVFPCWLELLQELSGAGPVDFNTQVDRTTFLEGSSAWHIDSTEQYAEFAAELGADTLVVDPWPAFESTGEALAGYVWTENVYFSSGIQQNELELAWEFVSSLLSADSQLALSNPNRAGLIPVHAAVPSPSGALGQMHEALLGGVPLPLWTAPERELEVLERAARAVSLQGADVETALRRAMEELTQEGDAEENADG